MSQKSVPFRDFGQLTRLNVAKTVVPPCFRTLTDRCPADRPKGLGGIARSGTKFVRAVTICGCFVKMRSRKEGYAMRDQWESTFVALDRLMAEMDAEAQGMVPEQR